MKFLLALVSFLGVVTLSVSVKIAAFNIQVLGKTKVSKDYVVDELVKIITRYDMVAIQEIRDIDQIAIYDLLDAVNAANAGSYTIVLAERVGRTSSKEQYCYMYKPATMTYVSSYTYVEPSDEFEREPFQAEFRIKSTGKLVAFSVLHAKPDDALEEMNSMVDVYDDMKKHYTHTNFILMGDFNADCSYASENELAKLDLRTDSNFVWLIDDNADTTVKSTHCAYDRFVVDSKFSSAISNVGIFNYQEEYNLDYELATDVSDHWPIELTI